MMNVYKNVIAIHVFAIVIAMLYKNVMMNVIKLHYIKRYINCITIIYGENEKRQFVIQCYI